MTHANGRSGWTESRFSARWRISPAILEKRPGQVSTVVVSITTLSRERLERLCELVLAA